MGNVVLNTNKSFVVLSAVLLGKAGVFYPRTTLGYG